MSEEIIFKPEETIPLYSGSFADFHWAGFGSGSGTNLVACAKIKKPALLVCDHSHTPLLDHIEFSEIPKMVFDGYALCGSWKAAQGNSEREARYQQNARDFNALILGKLLEFESQLCQLDLIVLGGYMRLLSEPLLSAYKDKIINVHPADLSVLAGGKRKYVGAHAVADALRAGEPSTRSSVILVDGGVDHGEILTQGPEVALDTEKFTALGFDEYVQWHQQQQKEQSDWPALAAAFSFISEGRLAVGKEKFFHQEWRRIYLDGQSLSYQGFRIHEGTKV